ncbi:MAG TPA: KUP/HAK/KT family potassium transporter, partial [Gemmatimonadaceae bacterium]
MTAQSKGAAEPAGEPPPAQAEPTPKPAGDAKAPAPSQTGQAATQTGFHAVVVPQRQHVEAHPTGRRLGILSLTALGIVYGDIGTSPLYALQQCFISKEHPIAPTTENVYGILSLIIWLLGLVVSVKYI